MMHWAPFIVPGLRTMCSPVWSLIVMWFNNQVRSSLSFSNEDGNSNCERDKMKPLLLGSLMYGPYLLEPFDGDGTIRSNGGDAGD